MNEYWINVYSYGNKNLFYGWPYYSLNAAILAAVDMEPKIIYRLHVRMK